MLKPLSKAQRLTRHSVQHSVLFFLFFFGKMLRALQHGQHARMQLNSISNRKAVQAMTFLVLFFASGSQRAEGEVNVKIRRENKGKKYNNSHSLLEYYHSGRMNASQSYYSSHIKRRSIIDPSCICMEGEDIMAWFAYYNHFFFLTAQCGPGSNVTEPLTHRG